MIDDSLSTLDLLMGPIGQRLLEEIGTASLDPGTELRLGTSLRREYPAQLVAAAFTLHELRLLAVDKFSRAAEMYFTRAGLEQASSEIAARHRAERFRPFQHVADLCTGIGGDLIALASHRSVLAVDLDPVHLKMARANLEVYEVAKRVTGVLDDVRETSLDGVEAIFIDPARRTAHRRLGPNRTEPPLEWCLGLTEKVQAVAIKAAPGIDHALVPDGWEIEFVADGRDLKESVLWAPAMATSTRRATILPQGQTLLPVPGPAVEVRAPGAYLLDPNPAVTRAGLVEDLARELGAWKIDEQIAFLTADRPLVSPFARNMRVIDSLPWRLRDISERLHALDIGAVDIRRRGLAGDVEDMRRRLKLRGGRRATLAMTRVQDAPWCLICVDMDADAVNGERSDQAGSGR